MPEDAVGLRGFVLVRRYAVTESCEMYVSNSGMYIVQSLADVALALQGLIPREMEAPKSVQSKLQHMSTGMLII